MKSLVLFFAGLIVGMVSTDLHWLSLLGSL